LQAHARQVTFGDKRKVLNPENCNFLPEGWMSVDADQPFFNEKMKE
jgi:hypothetical protein